MVSNDPLDKWPGCGGNFDDPVEIKTQNISFILDPETVACHQTVMATSKNLLLKHGFAVKGLQGAGKVSGGAAKSSEAEGGQGGQAGCKDLSEAQRDMIKGGSMITRVRKDMS